MPRVHTTRVEIDAPAGLVWDILASLPAYSNWNPSTPHVDTDGVPGHWIDLLVCIDDHTLIRELVVVRRWTHGEQLRWDRQTGPAWWSRCEHVQQVEPLGPERCCYIVTDTYAGLLAPLLELRDGARFERAAERTAAALKRRAEAIFDSSSPHDAEQEHMLLSPEIRDTFVLRGQFVPPPPRPPPDEPPDDSRSDPSTNCHVCEAPAGDPRACLRCGMLRDWTIVGCSHCPAKQAVCVPHLDERCDVYILECVACGTAFYSLCIC